eukprot:9943553-Lingulodinium_polyedra.AAC.1
MQSKRGGGITTEPSMIGAKRANRVPKYDTTDNHSGSLAHALTQPTLLLHFRCRLWKPYAANPDL